MTRLNLVLLLAVMASALYLVRLQYESRSLVTGLDRAVTEARKLEVEHERLQAERRAQATPLRVEKLAGAAGTKVTFGPLLFADDGGGVQIGQPTVKGVTVEAEIIDQGLAKKIIIFKYKRRKSYRRKAGHRQPYTALKITAISAGAKA